MVTTQIGEMEMIVDYLVSREAPGKEYTLVKPLMLPLSSFEI